MSRMELINGHPDREQDISVAEVLVRHKILQDTIMIYGMTMSIAALLCGVVMFCCF